ncbi:MAG: hypothetical protein IT384_04900 [Deltaproteobacteria bacterium]|nr:hypothetical protein [Deltaproteobacteria bacterium]
MQAKKLQLRGVGAAGGTEGLGNAQLLQQLADYGSMDLLATGVNVSERQRTNGFLAMLALTSQGDRLAKVAIASLV